MTNTTNTIKISVFLNTWKNYNENGADGGFWVNLPCDLNAELERLAASTGEEVDEMEVFINDTDIYGVKLEIGENDDIEELNETAETLESLDEIEAEALEAFIDHGYDLAEALEKISDNDYMIYYNCNDMSDVAYEYCEECGLLDSMPENLRNYFDYEAFGRDMGIEGNFYFTNGGNCIQIY